MGSIIFCLCVITARAFFGQIKHKIASRIYALPIQAINKLDLLKVEYDEFCKNEGLQRGMSIHIFIPCE